MTDTNDTSDGGNTKTPSRHRRVCFTLNNWTQQELDTIIEDFSAYALNYIIGDELGEEKKTAHLQGYAEFKNPRYFNSLKKIMPRAHIEKARGSKEDNIKYCSKDKILVNTFPLPRKIRLLKKYDNVVWKDWQQDIIDICMTKPDDRTINWIVDLQGNSGKSFLAKYLVLKFECIIADGKKDNIFNQVSTWLENNPDKDPNIILLDVPRHNKDYVNYGCLEQLKNGCIYSGKYEGGVCVFDHPHVFVFSNSPPDFDKFSKDRWNLINISKRTFEIIE